MIKYTKIFRIEWEINGKSMAFETANKSKFKEKTKELQNRGIKYAWGVPRYKGGHTNASKK